MGVLIFMTVDLDMGNPIPPLGEMNIIILQVYSMNYSVGIKSATQQPGYILNM